MRRLLILRATRLCLLLCRPCSVVSPDEALRVQAELRAVIAGNILNWTRMVNLPNRPGHLLPSSPNSKSSCPISQLS